MINVFKRTPFIIVIFSVLWLFVLQAYGDAVILKSPKSKKNSIIQGRVIEGKLIETNEKHVILETFGGKRSIPQERVYKHDPKKVSDFEKYESQIESLGKDAKGQIKLAEICEKGEGWQRARDHLKKALELEPDNKTISNTVTAALKRLETKEKEWEKKLPRPRVFTLRIGVKQNIPKEKIEPTADDEVIKASAARNPQSDRLDGKGRTIGDQAKAAAAWLIQISGKGIYIDEIIFTIGSAAGDLVYDETFRGTPNGWTSIPMGPQNWCAAVIVHELGHSNLGLPDCDNAANGGKWGKGPYPCIMAHNWQEGYGLCCRMKLGLFQFGKFADFLEDEIPDPPLPKITIKYADDTKKK
jgi:hypothetical protein